eukprot:6187124-Pleurochrysis_carterae.AAC.1
MAALAEADALAASTCRMRSTSRPLRERLARYSVRKYSMDIALKIASMSERSMLSITSGAMMKRAETSAASLL